jgi:RNA polymerase sigma-70 factor (ECF subfamily)
MEKRAFERLVQEHQQMVFCVALSFCHDRASAEDVAQECFLKAFRSMDGLKEPGRVKTWLYSIARFTAIDWVRRKGRMQTGMIPERAAPREAEPDDRSARALAVIRSLKDDHREIMLLRYVRGLSYAEIARELGSTVGAVGEKLSRVRALVRHRIEEVLP